MFVKQRRVRRPTKYQSKFTTGVRRRREYMASLYSKTLVQFLLCGFLLVAAYRSHVLMRDRFADLVWYGRLALPAIVLALAAATFRSLWRSIQDIREHRAELHPPHRD